MRKKWITLLVLALLLSTVGCSPVSPKTEESEIKNVILMISDGTSMGVSTLSRWFSAYDGAGGFDTEKRLSMDKYVSGVIRTYWQTGEGNMGAITDSAPGATALSTGYKSNENFLGIGSDEKSHATVLELAESMGKSTGLVATVYMQHATPGAFAAHTTDREDYETVAAQMLKSGVDVVLGGGTQVMQNRKDGRDLIAELKETGYSYVTTKDALAACENEKVYGLFAEGFMAYEIDRERLAPEQPKLSEMTGKALELLSQNDKGFFLMVEGSKVDWGAHNNDPAALVSEFLAFDEAVKVAAEYAESREDTMLVVVEDHGTGGISLGSSVTDKGYSSFLLRDVIAPLAAAQITGYGALTLLEQGTPGAEVLTLLGITDPTPEELAWINAVEPDLETATSESLAYIGNMISKRCNIGWTTKGHTGEDVLLYSYLPGGKQLVGLYENTDIATEIAKAWNTELTDAVCLHTNDTEKSE